MIEGYVLVYQRLRQVVIIPSCRLQLGRQPDLEGKVEFSTDKEPDDILGARCRRAFFEDRVCPSPESHAITTQAMKNADVELAALFGLFNSRSLFPKLKLLELHRHGDEVIVQPMRKMNGHYFTIWSSLWPEKQSRSIAYHAADKIWGMTVREGLLQA